MSDSRGNGQAQVSASEAAQIALAFLSRVTLTPAERTQYGIAEQLLIGIAQGRYGLSENPGQQMGQTLEPAPQETRQ